MNQELYDDNETNGSLLQKNFSIDENAVIDKSTKYKFLFPTYWGSTIVKNNKDGYISPLNKNKRDFYWIYGYIINIVKQEADQENREKEQQQHPEQDIPFPFPKNDNFSKELYNKMVFESNSIGLNGIDKYKIYAPTSSKDIIYSIEDKSNNSINFYGESNKQNIVITECKGDKYIELINFLIKIINAIIEQGNKTINLYLSKKVIDGYEKKITGNPLKDINNFASMGYFKTVALQDRDLYHLGMYKFIPIQNRGGRYTRKSRKTKSRKTKSRKTKSRK